MAVKEGNERIIVTFTKDQKEKLLFLCGFFNLSKTKTINNLITYMYDKLK